MKKAKFPKYNRKTHTELTALKDWLEIHRRYSERGFKHESQKNPGGVYSYAIWRGALVANIIKERIEILEAFEDQAPKLREALKAALNIPYKTEGPETVFYNRDGSEKIRVTPEHPVFKITTADWTITLEGGDNTILK